MMMAGTIEARTTLKSACGEGVPKMEAQKTSSVVAFLSALNLDQ